MNTKVATLRRWRILSAFLISEMRMALKLIDVVPDVNGFLVPAMGWQPIRVDYLNSQTATKITKIISAQPPGRFDSSDANTSRMTVSAAKTLACPVNTTP